MEKHVDRALAYTLAQVIDLSDLERVSGGGGLALKPSMQMTHGPFGNPDCLYD
jgi:hypothetical protein